MTKLEIVVGAQFGSEAKGHVVQRLTERAQRENGFPTVVRVAGPNAGHTGYDATGRAWALRQVPVAAVTEGHVSLGVAAGSEVDPGVLLDEFDLLHHAGLMKNKMLWVSGEATVIDDDHREIEAGIRYITGGGDSTIPEYMDNREIARTEGLVKQIGSTGKGIGAARADRMLRGAKRVKDDPALMDALASRGIPVADHTHIPGGNPRNLGHVIIEGTQGYGLGLHAGFYPQCTSSDCRAIDFMAMAGVHPWQFDQTEVWAVARMYPIRVAGNSGPLKDETTWEALGLPEERTTVTKKVRRVGGPDWDLVRRAVQANGGAPTVRVALTMVDQMFPELQNLDVPEMFQQQPVEHDRLVNYMKQIEMQVHAKIGMVTNGPNSFAFVGGGDGA